MRLKSTLAAMTLLTLAACGGSDSEHGVSTDPNGATGFITSNDFVPESALADANTGLPEDADGRPYTYGLLGQPLPEFRGETVGGGVFNSADINQWTVIDVWGIWCGDCIADGPFVAEVAARIALDEELDFVSIHTPPNAARAKEAFGKFGSVEAYFNAKGYSYPTVIDADASLRNLLQIGWTPSYLLVSPDGVVRGYRTDLSVAGETPVDDFFADIAAVRAKHAAIQPRIRKASIGPDGVDGVSGVTRFTHASVQKAFPTRTIVTGQTQIGEDVYPAFHVHENDAESDVIFTVSPNWDRGHVGFVETQSAQVIGPNGVQIGKLFFGELTNTETENCYPGTEDYAASIICNIGEQRQFQYIFSPSRADDGTVLSEASNEVLARAVLSAMRYLPPTPETL